MKNLSRRLKVTWACRRLFKWVFQFAVGVVLLIGVARASFAQESAPEVIPFAKLAQKAMHPKNQYEIRFVGRQIELLVIEASSGRRYANKTDNVNMLVSTLQGYAPRLDLKSKDQEVLRSFYLTQRFGSILVHDAKPYYLYDLLADFREYQSPEEEDSLDPIAATVYADKKQVVSMIGRFVSFEVYSSGYIDGTPHPWAYREVRAHNLWERGAEANLLDIVEEASLLQALRADAYLEKRLDTQTRLKLAEAQTFAEVNAALEEVGSCEWFWPDDVLSRFALYDYDVEKNQLMVRLVLPYGCDTRRGLTTELGLVVNPKARFRSTLKLAKEKSLGLFMKPQEKSGAQLK